MKIAKLIDILKLDEIAPFNEHEYGYEYDKIIDKNGINYWRDDSLSSFNRIDEKHDWYIFDFIRRKFGVCDGNTNCNMYYTVISLLKAIGEWKKLSYIDIEKYIISNTKLYVELLKEEIIYNLDFNQIEDMKDLIEIIKNKELYNKMRFCVIEYDYAKNTAGYKNFKIRNKYTFGNVKYFENLDTVNISAYDDYVELQCEKEGRPPHVRNLNMNAKRTIEEKIISAINAWSLDFPN